MKKLLFICVLLFGSVLVQAENGQEDDRGNGDQPENPYCPSGDCDDPEDEFWDEFELDGPSDDDEGIIYEEPGLPGDPGFGFDGFGNFARGPE
jgi:hypothetical protein